MRNRKHGTAKRLSQAKTVRAVGRGSRRAFLATKSRWYCKGDHARGDLLGSRGFRAGFGSAGASPSQISVACGCRRAISPLTHEMQNLLLNGMRSRYDPPHEVAKTNCIDCPGVRTGVAERCAWSQYRSRQSPRCPHRRVSEFCSDRGFDIADVDRIGLDRDHLHVGFVQRLQTRANGIIDAATALTRQAIEK
jgi:hypothetical protein